MVPYVVQVVCHHLVMFSGGVQSLTTTIRGAQTLAIKCIHRGTVYQLINILLIEGAVYVGVVESFESLSLDVIRNALASLTQLGLIRQPERWGN